MKIILGSQNISKYNSISLAMESLGISDYTIECIPVESNVSSKPLNDDILQGARNRNNNLIIYLTENGIKYDCVISIEGGYEEIDGKFFIVTYASIIDKDNNEFLGKSVGLEITKSMFEWVKKGNSLNKVIEEIIGNNNNKKCNGISGFLTEGFYKRDMFDSGAVQSALLHMINAPVYKELNESIKRKLTI